MIDCLPCPSPGCNHSRTGPNRQHSSKSTLLRHLNHDDHQATFDLADQSICTVVDIYSCTQHSCPTALTRFFRSLNKLTLHNNALHCPPPPIHSPYTTDQPSPTPTNTLDIGTSIFYADSKNGSHNLWHLGIPFILQNTDHPHLTSEAHGTDTSPHNSSNHQHSIHFPSIPPPSGGYSSTSTC